MTADLGLAARLIAGIRTSTPGATEWDTAGIASALREVGGTPGAAFAAAALAAEDTALVKPSAAAFRNHWPKNAGVEAPRGSMNVRCHRHPLSVVPCPQCAAEAVPPPLDDPEYLAMKAELAARSPLRPRKHKPTTPLLDDESADLARRRLEGSRPS